MFAITRYKVSKIVMLPNKKNDLYNMSCFRTTLNLMTLVHTSKFTFTSGQASKQEAENDINVSGEISRRMVFFYDRK